MLVTQSCPTLCDPMDCNPPGSSVHGIIQATILEWVAISYFRGPFQPRDGNCFSCISCIDRQILYHCATWEAQPYIYMYPFSPRASMVAQMVKKPAGNVGDLGSIPGSGRSPGEGHGNPLQYSCLDNPTDRGAWQATVHGVTKSWAQHSRDNSGL